MTKQISITLDKNIVDTVDKVSKITGLSRSKIFLKAVEKHLVELADIYKIDLGEK